MATQVLHLLLKNLQAKDPLDESSTAVSLAVSQWGNSGFRGAVDLGVPFSQLSFGLETVLPVLIKQLV